MSHGDPERLTQSKVNQARPEWPSAYNAGKRWRRAIPLWEQALYWLCAIGFALFAVYGLVSALRN